MGTVTAWFVLLAGLFVAFATGRTTASANRLRALLAVVLGLGVLLGWTWLQARPWLAVRVIPAGLLIFLEGTLNALLLLFVLGAASALCRQRRERVAVGVGVAAATASFLYGAMWMLQSTPVDALAQAPLSVAKARQSADFSCVPAACAAALGRLGVETSEAQMAALTHARPANGATLVRAVAGLNVRLAGTPWRAECGSPAWDGLVAAPMPALAMLRFERSRLHMVTVLSIKPETVLILDPVDGPVYLSRTQFEDLYAGQAIVFTGPAHDAAPVLATR